MSTPSNDSTAVTSTTDSTITDNTSSNTTPADDADEWQTVGQPKKKKNNKNKKNAAGNSNNSNNNNNHKQHNNSRSSAAADDSVQSDEDSDSDMAAQFMRDGNLGLDGRPVVRNELHDMSTQLHVMVTHLGVGSLLFMFDHCASIPCVPIYCLAV